MNDLSLPVRLELRQHPAAQDTVYAEAKAGQTIAELLGDGASHTVAVFIAGHEVPRELWPRVRPKAGQRLDITAYPQGGGSGNKLLKLVVLIVAVVYAYYTGDYGGALKIVAYGFTAVNLLVPPPQPKLPGAGDPFNTLASLTGTQNQASPYSPIPLVVGSCRFFPTHAALPYTEISGNDQYLRMLLDLGYGDIDVSDIQIGETPIDSYDNVEYEVGTAPTLFTQDVYELQVGTTLTANGANATRTSQDLSSELSIDVQFPAGLFGKDNKGNSVTGYTSFTVEYRPTAGGSWVNATTASGITMAGGFTIDTGLFKINSAASKTLRAGIRWKVPAGQYDVRVTRGASSWPSAASGATFGDAVWTVLRSISAQLPSTTGTTKLAIRIKATDKLQGVVSTVNCKVTQRIRTYDPATFTWTESVPTSNCAWVYIWLLTRCPGVARRMGDDRLDIEGLAAWAAECEAYNFTYNHVESSGRTLFDLLQDVLSAGRASFAMPRGKYGCVRDVLQTVPRQMFTPTNSWQFSGTRTFYDPPHALRCKWTNPEANDQQDELVVYAAGYSADGAGGTTVATRFEEMDLRVCTNPEAVWRLATYHLEAADKRPNTYSWMADIEHLVCEAGDLVTNAHDVVEWGSGSARIKSISGDRLSVTLAGSVTLEAGKLYGMQVRTDTGLQLVANTSTTGDGDFSTFAFASALDAAIQPGDLAVIGERSLETTRLIIKRVEPSDDLTARITAVDEAPSVPVAGTGTPPTFVSAITGTPWCSPPDIPDVVIFAGDSAPDDAGVIHAAPAFSSTPTGGIYRLPIYKRRPLSDQEAA